MIFRKSLNVFKMLEKPKIASTLLYKIIVSMTPCEKLERETTRANGGTVLAE